MADRFTYRIINEKGTVDFAATYDVAMHKYRQYAADCERGCSEFVSVIWVDPETSEEGVVFTYEPGNSPWRCDGCWYFDHVRFECKLQGDKCVFDV